MKKPIVRQGDMHSCPIQGHGKTPVLNGSAGFMVDDKLAACVGDSIGCGAVITEGVACAMLNGKLVAYVGASSSHGGELISGSQAVMLDVGGAAEGNVGVGIDAHAGNGFMDAGHAVDSSVNRTYGPQATQPIGSSILKASTEVEAVYSRNVVLGIHSQISGDHNKLTSGHAWITFSENRKVRYYGLWPDSNEKTVDNGKASDIRIGLEITYSAEASRYYKLSDQQVAFFEHLLAEDVDWTIFQTCASWASDVIYRVMKEDVDADDWLGFETPRELGKSILKLEAKTPTSPTKPLIIERRGSSHG